jgi:hypothetical protein
MQSDRNESKSCFYCGRPGHVVKGYHNKNKDDFRNKPRTHSCHYAEKSSNQDLRLFIASDDIDEPTNFDSRDLRLLVSNAALFAKLILNKHIMEPAYILEMTALI